VPGLCAAEAQLARAFVAAASGADVNDCSRNDCSRLAPCRTFAGALPRKIRAT